MTLYFPCPLPLFTEQTAMGCQVLESQWGLSTAVGPLAPNPQRTEALVSWEQLLNTAPGTKNPNDAVSTLPTAGLRLLCVWRTEGCRVSHINVEAMKPTMPVFKEALTYLRMAR